MPKSNKSDKSKDSGVVVKNAFTDYSEIQSALTTTPELHLLTITIKKLDNEPNTDHKE